MINKKLDDILQDISILKDIFNNNEYFKKIEEATERQNKWNNELVEKINNLQSKIDKAIEFINSQKKTISKSQADLFNEDRDDKPKLKVGTFMWNVDELLSILKEDK